jgi:peptidoglycan hydrolase-like protein with peptidoglycan-binding domain
MNSRMVWLSLSLALAIFVSACDSPDTDTGTTSKAMEQRMREIEKKMKDSMPKTQQIALAQKPNAAVVQKAQADLRALNEYLEDPPSGKIDMVTVNAIEAFQRRAGLKDDGLLNDETLKKLDEAAKSAGAGAKPNGAS